MEIDTHINRHSDVILSWNISNWALESNSVLGNHNSDLIVCKVAASIPWRHDSLMGTPFLFKCEHTVWNVHFAIAAAWFIYDNSHNWCTEIVVLRKKSWSFFWIWAINLNQMSLWSQLTLGWIKQRIVVSNLCLHCAEPVVLLLLAPHWWIYLINKNYTIKDLIFLKASYSILDILI